MVISQCAPSSYILLVEDDLGLRKGFCAFLQEHYSVIAAASFAEATEAVLRNGAPSVLITDFDLGGMLPEDGLGVADQVRMLAPETPILVTTGTDLAHPRLAELVALPGVMLFRKPFEPDAILRAIARQMKRAE
jgi:CheY-like chemotaxis protein